MKSINLRYWLYSSHLYYSGTIITLHPLPNGPLLLLYYPTKKKKKITTVTCLMDNSFSFSSHCFKQSILVMAICMVERTTTTISSSCLRERVDTQGGNNGFCSWHHHYHLMAICQNFVAHDNVRGSKIYAMGWPEDSGVGIYWQNEGKVAGFD